MQTSDFSARGAPSLKRYFSLTELGYGFTLLKNDETDASYEETVQYTMFESLQLMG